MNISNRLLGFCAVLAASLLAVSSPMAAPLLNLDFGTLLSQQKTGIAATGHTDQDVWNLYARDVAGDPMQWKTDGSEYDLRWSDGSASTIDLRVQNAPGAWNVGTADPMMDIYLYPFGPEPITVTLSEVPQGYYNLLFYAHGQPPAENAVVELLQNGLSLGELATSSDPDWNSHGWSEGRQYVVFRSLPVLEAEDLVLKVKAGAGGIAVMNGLQLEATTGQPFALHAQASTTQLWPPNGQMVPVTFSAQAIAGEDRELPWVTSRIVSVTCNEVFGKAARSPRNTEWRITGDLTVDLRARKLPGRTNFRIYTVTIEGTDLDGTTETAVVKVVVPPSAPARRK